MKLKILGVIFLALLLSSCGTRPAPMSKKVQQKLTTVDSSLIITQSNLDVTLHNSTNIQGHGLLGALVSVAIDSARQSYAQNKAKPMMKTLQKYDFREVMLKSMNQSFAKLKKINMKLPVKLDTIGTDLSKKVFYDNAKGDAILLCNARYRYASSNLHIYLDARIYPKSEALKLLRKNPNDQKTFDNSNTIYYNSFVFKKEGVTAENIQVSLDEAAANLIKQLSMDLDHGI